QNVWAAVAIAGSGCPWSVVKGRDGAAGAALVGAVFAGWSAGVWATGAMASGTLPAKNPGEVPAWAPFGAGGEPPPCWGSVVAEGAGVEEFRKLASRPAWKPMTPAVASPNGSLG